MATSNSWQNSTSEPIVVRTPENDIINQLSSVAAGLAQQMNQWAQGVFAQTSQITNQTVGNFFQVSQKMMGLSNTLTDQYNDVFAPQNRSLAAEANSYNSDARQKLEMGKAGATQAQAGDAAMRDAEESLRTFGINPNDGRYAALEKAGAVQNAANNAGAQNMARDRTAATGRELRSQAVQVGAQLPAAIANINNTAIQANTGASNASLANANTGANLQRLANEYLKTAMDVKLPPVGNRTQGSGGSQSFSPDQGGGGRMSSGGGGRGGGSGGGYGGGSGGGSGGGGYGPAWMPQHGGAGSAQIVQNRSGAGGPAKIMQTGQGWQDSATAAEGQGWAWSPNDYYQPESDGQGGWSSMNVDNSHQNQDIWNGGSAFDIQDNPYQDPGFGQEWDGSAYNYGGGADYDTYTGGDGATDTQWGNINYDTSANEAVTGWENYYDQPAAYTDWGGSNAAYQSYDQPSSGGGGYSAPENPWGEFGGNDDYYAYAAGGAVPASMSPSGGQQVDDIPAMSPAGPAQLNADEFVIPRDVALWKGQEFFQNLIDQSRKKRVTAPAKPSVGGAPQQQPMR